MQPHSDPGRIDVDAIQTRAAFAAALTQLRQSAGLTVRELAKQVGTPAGTLGDYFGGRHLPSVGQQSSVRAILTACGVTERAALDRWLEALGRARAGSDRRGPRAAAPYPGLKPFEAADTDLFFGRSDETGQILARLAELRSDPGPSAGLLAVVGPSGSGKSSLLRAGVAAAIGARSAAAAVSNQPDPGRPWTCAVLTPGTDPLAALAAATGDERPDVIVIDQFEEIFTAVDAGRRETFLRLLPQHAPGRVVVLGLRADFYAEAAREPVLLGALQHAQIVVGPLRPTGLADAILRPAQAVGLTVEDGLVDLLTAELAPHDASGSAHDAGALPLLSHALRSTWELSTGRGLTIEAYRRAGGIEAAVQRTAEELYTSLEPAERELARRIFLRLVHLDDIAVTRRRISATELSRTERPGGASVASVVDRFVERRLLTASNTTVEITHEALLSAWPRLRDWVDADRAGLRLHRQLTEAATAWQQSGRDVTLLLRGTRLEVAAEWATDLDHRRELDPVELAFLVAGTRERNAERTRERHRTRRLRRLLSAVAVLAVVAAGLAGYALHARSTAQRDGQEATMARNNALSRQVAFQSRDLEAQDPALAEQLALVAYKIDPTEEARGTVIDQSTRPVITRILGADGPTALATSPDGRLIAVGHADDGSVHLYRTNTDRPPTALDVLPGGGPHAQVFALAFSSDSALLAVGGQTEHVGLWSVRDADHPQRLATLSPGFTGAVESIAFSPDSPTLAAGSSGRHPVQEWDVSHPTAPVVLDDAPGVPATTTIQAVAFSPDGSLLVAGGTGDDLYIWPNTAAGEPASPQSENPGPFVDPHDPSVEPVDQQPATSKVLALAFARRGDRLYVGTSSGEVTIWGTATGTPTELATPLTAGGNGQANTLAVSADGTQVAIGDSADDVQQWDANTRTLLSSTGNPGPVTGVAYSTDGSRLFSTAADGTLRIWPAKVRPISDGGHVFALGYSNAGARLLVSDSDGPGPSGIQMWDTRSRARPVAVGPKLNLAGAGHTIDGTGAVTSDGRIVAGGNSIGQVELWDDSDPLHPRPITEFRASAQQIESIAFSPDNRLLAVGADDGTASLWDVSDAAHPRPLSTVRGGSLMLDVAFSADGSMLAGANADDTAHLWDVDDPTHPSELATLRGFKSYVYGVAFSPDNHMVAVSGADHTVRLWSLQDRHHPVRVGPILIGAANYAFALAFSPNGKLLAVASADHSVRLYSLTHLTAVPFETLDGVDGDAYTVTFSPNSKTLVAGGLSPALATWSVNPKSYVAAACPMAGDPITRQEWSLYVPGAKYDPPCT